MSYYFLNIYLDPTHIADELYDCEDWNCNTRAKYYFCETFSRD
jgi:hypothetical protein